MNTKAILKGLMLLLPALGVLSEGQAAEYVAYAASTAPAIDGEVSEFAGAETIDLSNLNGTSGTYRLLYDATHLYVAVEVVDTNLNHSGSGDDGSLWRDDSLELMLDTAHDHGATPDNDDYKFWVNVNGVRRDQQALDGSWDGTWTSTADWTGTINNNTDADTGYTLELAIPWSTLGFATPPGASSSIGLQVAMNDRQASGDYSMTLWSTPTGGPNVPGNWGDLNLSETVLDTAAPTVSITAPADQGAVWSSVIVTANASDDVDVAGVQFKLDGVNLGQEDLSTPYAVNWDTTGASDGQHTLTAVARDAAGHETISATVTVIVDNTTSSTTYTVTEASTTPVIDGDISEFAVAQAIHLSNTNGTSGTYRLLYDDDNLYVAAEVLDGNLNTAGYGEDGNLWREDSLELMLDTAHDHGTSIDNDDYKFWLNVSGVRRDQRGTDGAWDGTWTSAADESGTINNNTDTDTGYTLELSIPWSTIGLATPLGPDSAIGLQIGMNDRESSGIYSMTLWANPSGGPNVPDNWGDLRSTDHVVGPTFAAMSPPSTILPGFACWGCAEWDAYIDTDPDVEVRYITNRNTSGTGSFKAAISDCTPGVLQVIIPTVSGTVDYPQDSSTAANCDNQIYAGQYAPSPGLCIKGLRVGLKGPERQLWMHYCHLGDSTTQGTGKGLSIFSEEPVNDIVIINFGSIFPSDSGIAVTKGSRDVSVIQTMTVYPVPNPGTSGRQIVLIGEDSDTVLTNNIAWYRNVGTHFTVRCPRVVDTSALVSNNVCHNGNLWLNVVKIDHQGRALNILDNLYTYGSGSAEAVEPIAFDAVDVGTIIVDFDAHVAGNRTWGRDDTPESILIEANSNGHWSDPGSDIAAAKPAGYVSTDIGDGEAGERAFANLVCKHAGPRPGDPNRLAIWQQACDQIDADFEGLASGNRIASPAEHNLGYPTLDQNDCDPAFAGDCGPGVPALTTDGSAQDLMDDLWTAHCAVMPSGATGC